MDFAGKNTQGRPKAPWAPRLSLRTVLAGLVLACLLPGFIGAALFFVHDYREGRAQLEKDTVQTARALAQTVDSYLLRARAVGETLASDESLARGDFPAFRQRAREVVARTGVGSTVVLVDESLWQVFNLRLEPGQALPRSPNPDLVRRVFASGQPAISDLFQAPLLKRPLISVFVPVVIRGKVAYVLSIGVLAEEFSTILRTQSLPPGWVGAIFDSTGTIVARTQAEDQFVGQKGSSDYIESIRQAPEGSVETVTRDGIPVRSSFSRSPLSGWTVGIGIPRQEFNAGLSQTLAVLGLGVIGLFTLGLGLAWFLERGIARGVRALALDGGEAAAPRFEVAELADAAALLRERTAALEAGKALLQAVFEQAAVGIARVGLDGRWLQVNDRLCAIVGYEPAELQCLRFQDITYSRDLAADLELSRGLLAGEFPTYGMEKRYIRKDGSLVWVHLTGSLVRTPQGEPDYFIAVVEDIQARKEAKAALENARQTYLQHLEQQVEERTAALREAHDHLEERVAQRTEEVRRLAAELTYAEERERQALARDLHDDLGQLLHVVKLKLDLLDREKLPPRVRALVDETGTLIADASCQVRSLTSQLSPPILSTLGLPAALEWLCGEMQQNYDLAVSCSAAIAPDRLSPAQGAILFRAARELLINVAKHSGSASASLALAARGKTLTLTVADPGRGIPSLEEALAGARGFGLASVRERIAYLGGTMDIETTPGLGVRITLALPLETCLEAVKVDQ